MHVNVKAFPFTTRMFHIFLGIIFVNLTQPTHLDDKWNSFSLRLLFCDCFLTHLDSVCGIDLSNYVQSLMSLLKFFILIFSLGFL